MSTAQAEGQTVARGPGAKRRQWLLAATSLVLLAAGNWWLGRIYESDSDFPPPVGERIDYALVDFAGEFFDERGRLSLRLSGPRLEHEANTRRARVADPVFTFEPGGRNWHGTAARAVLDRDSELLVLEEEVLLTTPHPDGTITVESGLLRYDRAAGTVVSPGPVRIRQDGTELTGGTLTLWIDDERMELQQDVHAIYRPAGGRGSGADRRRD